jgi:uncharacterized protein YllA (UPF0747 family)
MKDYLKVEGHSNYYRDPVTKAIIIVDENKRQNYLNQRKIQETNFNNYETINNEINDMKKDISDIKEALGTLLNILNKNTK